MASLNAFPLGTVAVTPETLAACAALSALPDASFAALVRAVAESAAATAGSASGDAQRAHASLSPLADAAAALRVLQALLLDFAKCATPPAAARGALEGHGLAPAKAALFADAYAAVLDALRAALADAGAMHAARCGLGRPSISGAASPAACPRALPPFPLSQACAPRVSWT